MVRPNITILLFALLSFSWVVECQEIVFFSEMDENGDMMPTQDQVWNDFQNEIITQDGDDSPDLNMVLDVRVVTFFEEQDNLDEQVDELQWGQTQRIVFSFTNPSNATVIRLDNITAYFLDTESS